MEFFDELNRSVSGVSRVGGLKNLISEEEKKINALYVEIGTLYFESNKNNPGALYSGQIAGIKEALARIDGYNNQIYMTRGGAPAGAVCSKCGNPMALNDRFCAVCGNPAGNNQPTGVPCCKCGAVLPAGSAFCAVCGAKQEPPQPEPVVNCKSCGAILDKNSAFCMVCGTKVVSQEEVKPAEEPVAEEVSAVSVEEATAKVEAEVVIEEENSQEPVWTPVEVYEEAFEETDSASENMVDEATLAVSHEEVTAEDVSDAAKEEEISPEPVQTLIEDSKEDVPLKTAPAEEVTDEVISEPVEELSAESVIEITAEECAEETMPVNNIEVAVESVIPVASQIEETTDDITAQNPYVEIVADNICKVCGKEVAPTAKFCIYCGTKR